MTACRLSSATVGGRTSTARNGGWCNWQHSGFWTRQYGFESCSPSESTMLAKPFGVAMSAPGHRHVCRISNNRISYNGVTAHRRFSNPTILLGGR